MQSLAQTKVKGTVLDEEKRPLPFANVQLTELHMWVSANEKGEFSYTLAKTSAVRQITFAVSYVGKLKLERKVTLQPNKLNTVELILQDNNLYLSEVEINAQRVHTTNSNSSIVIEQAAIEQIQPYSLADILSNLLPGQTITNPNLQSAKSINLRSAATGAHAQLGQFGTAVIVDGEALSNNANLQEGGNGRGFNTTFTPGTYGNADYTFSSVDLRQIPVNNIEKIEVIQGVASAKYGDMTDGAILIDRKAGVTPWSIRAALQNGTDNIGINKGFVLSPKLGALNVSLDYLNSTPSNTNRSKSYKRIATGLLWSTFLDKQRKISSHLGLDYSTSFDNYNADSERDNEIVKVDNTQLRLNYRGSWKTDLAILNNLSYSFSYSANDQFSYESRYLNQGVSPMANTPIPGVSEGIFTYPNYQAETSVYGAPKRLSFSLNASKNLTIGNVEHRLAYGGNYSLESNRGQGYAVDPYSPRWKTSSSRGQSRDFAFEQVPSLQNVGLYLEDGFTTLVLGKELIASAGIRLDRQFDKWSVSPRISSSLALNEQTTLKAAYGIATKSPGLVHIQPKPIYFDFPLLNYYTNNYKENLVLYYTHVLVPDNSQLRSMRSQNLELGLTYRKPQYNVSVTAFSKRVDNGFNSKKTFDIHQVPVYTIVEARPNEKPVYALTGATNKAFSYYSQYTNSLNNESYGLELLLSTAKIDAIQTSFNFSTTLYYSKYYNSDVEIRAPSVQHVDKYALIGVYYNPFAEGLESVSTLSTSHHISKLGLLLNFRAQFFWDSWQKKSRSAMYPIGFYNPNGEYIAISEGEQTSEDYQHLILEEGRSTYQHIIYSNYHLKLSKEIHKLFRLSFYANNFLNYRPQAFDNYYGTFVEFNEAPAFGMELRLTIK